jgi:hypothetical protein
MKHKLPFMLSLLWIGWLATSPAGAQATGRYPWPRQTAGNDSIQSRFAAPPGFRRIATSPGSFGDWLRNLPLRSGRPAVRMYDGQPKPRQDVHAAIVDLDVGRRDLQQCADTIIRLRAEYLRAAGREREIGFRFTSGHLAAWSAWADGQRPDVCGNRVTWRPGAARDASYPNFRRYLDTVFMYAGTLSLSGELDAVPEGSRIEIGDVFIEGGSPGHAVLVVDVAEAADGRRVFLLVQGFLPAQEAHILVNPGNSGLSPWYDGRVGDRLATPEWTFRRDHWRRFHETNTPRESGRP